MITVTNAEPIQGDQVLLACYFAGVTKMTAEQFTKLRKMAVGGEINPEETAAIILFFAPDGVSREDVLAILRDTGKTSTTRTI